MSEHKKQTVSIGMWYSHCCPCDLYQIETEEERAEIQAMLDEPDIETSMTLFASLDDAWQYYRDPLDRAEFVRRFGRAGSATQ